MVGLRHGTKATIPTSGDDRFVRFGFIIKEKLVKYRAALKIEFLSSHSNLSSLFTRCVQTAS